MRVLITILCVVILIDPVAGYTYNLPYQTLDEEIHNLDSFENEYVLFEIMTTWCDICKTEMEELKEVYSSVTGLMEIISIGVDLKTDTIETLQDYQINYGVNWTFARDHEGAFFSTFNVVSFPVMVFLGKDGNLINKWVGYTSSKLMLDEISKYLPIEYDQSEDDLDNLNDLVKGSLLIPFSVFMGIFIVVYITYNTIMRFNRREIKA